MSQPATPLRAAATELLLVSPSRLPLSASSSAQKRRVTPSAEASSPKKVAVLTLPDAIPRGQHTIPRGQIPNPLSWLAINQQAHIGKLMNSLTSKLTACLTFWILTGHALADSTWSLLLPNPLLQLRNQDLPRHISLPFNIGDEGAPDPASGEVFDICVKLFPGLQSLGSDKTFLDLTVTPLPPKPWPKTIGGMPCRFYPDLALYPSQPPVLLPDQVAHSAKHVSVRNGQVANTENYRDAEDWDPLFRIIRDHFDELAISITEVMYKMHEVIIVLEHRNTDMTRVPCTIAQVLCGYFFEDQMGRPAVPQARRERDPSPGNPDDSQYQALRPGVRVTSTYLPEVPDAFISSTAGVLVKDQAGDHFLTVAEHAFPAKCGTRAMHPSPNGGRAIGELIMGVGHTDIALVKLHQSEHFTNTTFHNTLMDKSVPLKRLAPCKQGDLLYLDSPNTGCIDGTVKWAGRRRFPSDDPTEHNWVLTTWIYMGQESAWQLPEGMCGSAIWMGNGDVVGFFQYAPKEGVMVDWCAGIDAMELLERGYTLVEGNPDR